MPEYLHPSVHSRIIDNSFVFQTAAGTTVLFACGKATKGPDNKLTRLTSVGEAKFIFGEPDMAETGQTLYNVYNWLSAGGEVYFIRVLPEDAQFANALISIGLDTNGSVKTVVPKLSTIAGASSIEAMQTILGASPTVDGTTTFYPVGALVPYGRGKAYDGLGFRITPMDSLDATYDFRTYTFEIAAKNSLGADVIIDGPYTVAFEPTARDKNRESLYYANVVNKYSKFFRVLDRKDFFDEIREFINPSLEVNPLHIDIFFGQERNGVSVAQGIHQAVKFATSLSAGLAENQVTLASAADLKSVSHITGGTDGTWTGGNSEDALLVKAYKGEIDNSATDKKQYLFDVMLDGNNSDPVKNAMSDMAFAIRGDCVALVDCGFQANVAQTVAKREGALGMSSFTTAIYAQDFVVYDEYTGQNIKVTLPYFLAKKIPPNDDQFGVQYSFSGPRRGVLSGFDAVNFFPNEMEKETLYKKQINYVEKDPKRINIGTQLTSQTVNSALSNLNNVRALLRIKRDVEAMVDEYRDEFNDTLTHEAMSYNLNSYLKKWETNRTCKSINGSVYASDYDRQQKIVRVKVEMVFTGLIERIFADFIINR
jgi:hypothetical protein